MASDIRGLSEQEAKARRARGLGNDFNLPLGRSYLQILQKNAFTFINTVLFAISIFLIALGQYGDAGVTAGLVLLNVFVAVFQEARAKRRLEQIALLARPKASVIRDGQERTVDPQEVVLGDVLVANPGDQIIVDGQILNDGRVEVDESLLTGESEPILKECGDPVNSGSFCVSGTAIYEAERVGADSIVNQMTAGARAIRTIKTPLQREINFIIRLLVLLAVQLGVLLGISFVMRGVTLVDSVRVAAVIVALVPQGLFFMTTVAYAIGAVRVAGNGALIQEANAIESISHVNLLCMDKTGTLTTNRIKFYAMQAADETGDRATLERILGDFGANLTGGNRTLEALCEAFPGQTRQVATSVPFTSEQKWSALSYHEPALSGIYVLGAPEVLIPYVGSVDLFSSQLNEWIDQGLRVLLFAHHPDSPPLYDPQGDPQLPTGLNALCLLCFCDELRPEAAATIGHFAELNIKLKIISGDHPGTVAALSSQVGFASDSRTVSGLDLTNLKADQVATLAEEASIFGRITPKQKENLVGIYRQKGYYVGMIGDGVNDMLSLKGADVGIAMRSGSQATRSVADIVLLEDSFAPLPFAFREGQRIVKGMEDVIRLLLTRTFYVLMLIIASQIVGVAFPVTPKHNSIIALLTVGIPILAIAAWARPSAPPHSVVRATSHFVLPAAFSISVFALIVYLSYLGVTEDVVIARSALTTTMVLCGLVLIPFVEPPTKAWVAGDVLSGDWRPTLLAMGMLILFIVILAVPTLRNFFELTLMPAQDYVFIAIGVVVWAVLLRLIWRVRLFESFLDLRRA